MLSPAVTVCERSYYGVTAQPGQFTGHYPHEGCDNPGAPCSVRDIAHLGHNWLARDWEVTEGTAGWRHCNGVIGGEEER